MARVVWALGCIGAVASLAASTACVKDDTSTQITVAIWSEAQVPNQMNAIEVKVFASDGSLKIDQRYPVSNAGGGEGEAQSFPATLSVVPSDSSSLDAPVTVEVDGISGADVNGQGGQLELLRRAVVSFVQDRSLYLPMPLRMACLSQLDCSTSESCVGGTCVSADVSASSLADYTPAVLFGLTPGASCFSEEMCLAGSTPVTVTPVLDASGAVTDCTFPLPASAASANVSVQWKSDSGRIVALDSNSPLEGWTVDSTHTNVGHLSLGACEAITEPQTTGAEPYVPDKALSAWVSTACPAKTPLQPFCPQADGEIGTGVAIPATN
jgi:hypothetical protein